MLFLRRWIGSSQPNPSIRHLNNHADTSARGRVAAHRCHRQYARAHLPGLPNVLVRTADDIYVRLHGPERWYRHDYSDDELKDWAEKIQSSGAKTAWIYFNN